MEDKDLGLQDAQTRDERDETGEVKELLCRIITDVQWMLNRPQDLSKLATSQNLQWQIETLRALYNDAKTQRNELIADMLKISRTYLADAHRIADAALKKYKFV